LQKSYTKAYTKVSKPSTNRGKEKKKKQREKEKLLLDKNVLYRGGEEALLPRLKCCEYSMKY